MQTSRIKLLDLGCGTGDSYDKFSRIFAGMRWIGLDILDSAEVAQRSIKKLPFCSYDGIRVPLANDSIDIVYSRQVFEHVRYPERVIGEIHRILRRDGLFVGSTSHLEPFHSRSYWNYTPYGFGVLLKDAGFVNVRVRPSIDSLTLIVRKGFSYLRLANCFDKFFELESPMNSFFEIALRMLKQPANRRNAVKLLFSGQFSFLAQKK